ncbi:MAG: hypothetical protein LBV23_00955 [Deltaproteobacteria bacterium]|jgi:hypothetical protein|nr:hypothetical protein [Deltaproteobacteria bacterium]
MSYFFYALRPLIWKELLAIFKDKRGHIILVFTVLVQTFLFGYIDIYDLEKIDYSLLDEDHSVLSRQYYCFLIILRRCELIKESPCEYKQSS